MDKALDIYQKNDVKYLFLLGGAAHNKIVESKAMREYALKNGIDRNSIFIDSLSNTTIENTKNLISIIKYEKLQINNAALVSSNYHINRVSNLIECNTEIKYLCFGANYPNSIGVFGKIMALFREMVMFLYHQIYSYRL